MKFKNIGFVAAFLLAFSLGSILHGQISLSPSRVIVNVGANEVVNLTASGSDLVNNLDLIAIINGNNGTGPVFSAAPVTGLSVLPATPFFGTNIPQAIDSTFTVATPSSVDGQDVVALSFDTTSLSPGDTFDLDLGFGGTDTLFSSAAAGAIETNFSSPIEISIVDVPEPSSIAFLLGAGSLAMLRRRKRA